MSSYSKFRFEGPDAAAFLDHIGSAKVPARDGKMALSLILNEPGGIIGDMTVARLAENRFYAVGATLGEAIYRRWFDRQAKGFHVSIATVTSEMGVLGLAGPNSRAVLQLVSDDDFANDAFPFMTAREVEIGRVRALALRVSYSGELGWELHAPIESLRPLFLTLIEAGEAHGLTLAGSRALGNLRLEKGYRSWGAELTIEVSPRAAGLERFCSTTKDYIGRAAVDAARETAPKRAPATLAVEANGADCWGSEPIFKNGALIGYATSGGYGWRVGKSLAVGWIDFEQCQPGNALEIQILETMRPAVVVADPIYDPNNANLLS